MVDIGIRIKTMRKMRGLSQKNLGDKIGKAATTISSYENNVQTPPTDVLQSIAYALYVPIDYFFGAGSEKLYSSTNLTAQQKLLLDLLFKEFSAPSGINGELSGQQVDIIKRLILIFTNG